MHAGSKPQGRVVPWGSLSSAQALIMPHLLSIAGPHPVCCTQTLNPVLTVSDQGSEVNINSSWWLVRLTMNPGLFSAHALFHVLQHLPELHVGDVPGTSTSSIPPPNFSQTPSSPCRTVVSGLQLFSWWETSLSELFHILADRHSTPPAVPALPRYSLSLLTGLSLGACSWVYPPQHLLHFRTGTHSNAGPSWSGCYWCPWVVCVHASSEIYSHTEPHVLHVPHSRSQSQERPLVFPVQRMRTSKEKGDLRKDDQLSQAVLVVKNPPTIAGAVRDASSIPGSGRSPGGRHSNPL